MTIAPDVRHIVIDMQRLFAEDTVWHTPAVTEILPNVLELCRIYERETIFAKFMLPQTIEHAEAGWQRYYRRWSMLTLENIDPAIQDLVQPLKDIASADSIVEKTGYSVFSVPGFSERLRSEQVGTLIFSGVESDVCVLASVFDAVDAGFSVVIATDAVGSSSPEAHRASIDLIYPRVCDQVQLSTTSQLITAMR